ncbi:MAG: transporter substrate-binding domain-containing protein, partial [Reinekea sp.]|nr:transporter substrate-binding domain-containing protein [Reinekea sp.]
ARADLRTLRRFAERGGQETNVSDDAAKKDEAEATPEPKDVGTLIINRGYQYARFGNNPNIRKFEVNNFEQGFKMLISGRADYYLVNRTVGQFTLNQMKLQYVHPLNMKIDDPSDVYLAFYRSEALKPISDAFARQLRQFKGTEAYQRILAKYGIQP